MCAATAQSVRAGAERDDLDDVATARHHTFFECGQFLVRRTTYNRHRLA